MFGHFSISGGAGKNRVSFRGFGHFCHIFNQKLSKKHEILGFLPFQGYWWYMHSGYSFGKPTHASHTTKNSRSPTIILLPWFLFKVEVIYHFRAWKRTISFLYQNLAIYNFVFVITFVWINFSKIQTVRTKLWVFKTF